MRYMIHGTWIRVTIPKNTYNCCSPPLATPVAMTFAYPKTSDPTISVLECQLKNMPTLWESLKEHNNGMCLFSIPIGSMYGKFTYLWLIYGNVGTYTMHGSYGKGNTSSTGTFSLLCELTKVLLMRPFMAYFFGNKNHALLCYWSFGIVGSHPVLCVFVCFCWHASQCQGLHTNWTKKHGKQENLYTPEI